MNRKIARGITLPAKDRQRLASLACNGGTWFSREIIMRLIPILVVLLMAPVAVAQVQLGKRVRPSTEDRLFGARPFPIREFVFTLGSPNLRYLAPGARQWKTLATNPGLILKQVALNDAGTQVLAAWQGDNYIHLFTLENQKHTRLPKPRANNVKTLGFAANGRDAVVYMDFERTYRVALDGESEPELIIPFRWGSVLKVTTQGMLFARADKTDTRCNHLAEKRCFFGIVASEITDKGVKEKTIFSVTPPERLGVAVVPGGDDRYALLAVQKIQANGRLGEHFYLNYDLAAAKTVTTVPMPTEPEGGRNAIYHRIFKRRLVSQARNEYVDLYRKGTDLEIRIIPLTPDEDERRVFLRSRGNSNPTVHGFVAKSDGSVWIHWGDDLFVLDANDGVRALDLNFLREPFGREKTQWADSTWSAYETNDIWVGIEQGTGRYFARVDFPDFDKRASAWPTVSPEEYDPHCCEDLPDEKTLATWRLNLELLTCGYYDDEVLAEDNKQFARYSHEVVRKLSDATLIIKTRDGSCARVIPKDCEEIRRKRTPTRNRNRNRNR